MLVGFKWEYTVQYSFKPSGAQSAFIFGNSLKKMVNLIVYPELRHYTLYHGLAIYREVPFVNVTSVAEKTK